MRYIDEPTVASVLRTGELIPVMRQAMIDFSQGRIAQPARRIIAVPSHGGFFASMPAAAAGALGAKLEGLDAALHRRHAAYGSGTSAVTHARACPASGGPLHCSLSRRRRRRRCLEEVPR